MFAQPEVNAQIVLRKVTSATQNLAQLQQLSGGGPDARIQSQPIALDAFQLKADPMVLRASFGTQDHGRAYQVFNDGFHSSIVEEIADREPTAHLRDLNRVSNQLAGISESSVLLIDEQKLRLQVSGRSLNTIHLRIHMSVDQKEIHPAIVVEVDKGVAPAHIALCAPGNA